MTLELITQTDSESIQAIELELAEVNARLDKARQIKQAADQQLSELTESEKKKVAAKAKQQRKDQLAPQFDQFMAQLVADAGQINSDLSAMLDQANQAFELLRSVRAWQDAMISRIEQFAHRQAHQAQGYSELFNTQTELVNELITAITTNLELFNLTPVIDPDMFDSRKMNRAGLLVATELRWRRPGATELINKIKQAVTRGLA